jgi:hypothetical protein
MRSRLARSRRGDARFSVRVVERGDRRRKSQAPLGLSERAVRRAWARRSGRGDTVREARVGAGGRAGPIARGFGDVVIGVGRRRDEGASALERPGVVRGAGIGWWERGGMGCGRSPWASSLLDAKGRAGLQDGGARRGGRGMDYCRGFASLVTAAVAGLVGYTEAGMGCGFRLVRESRGRSFGRLNCVPDHIPG